MSTSGDLKAYCRPAWLRLVARRGRENLAVWAGWLRRASLGRSRPHRWYRPSRIAVSAAIVLAGLTLVVMSLDAWAIRAALASPPGVRALFEVVTDFGRSGWILWPVGIVLLGIGLVTGPSLGRLGAAVMASLAVRLTFIFAAIAVPGLFTAIVKRLIGRARPLVEGGVDPFRYDPFVWKAAYASLPSGHTTTAFSAAVAIGALWPQTRPYVWVYAVLIAISRVAVTAHHPSDVLVGAVVGTIGALLIRDWFANRRLVFAVDVTGRIRRLPGPSWDRIKTVVRRLGGA